MKNFKTMLASLSTAALMTAVALNFNACSQQSPLQPISNEGISLAKTSSYPQFSSSTFGYRNKINGYMGGKVKLPGGSTLRISKGALTPPPGTPFMQDVTITILVEKSADGRNELVFTFGPSGCQFSPAAEVTFDWTDLEGSTVNLYYIDENGNYILQSPDNIDFKNKKMTIFVDHFSRYAIGTE